MINLCDLTREAQLLLKRLLDVIVAGLALCLLTPAMVLIALAVRLTLGIPVLFRQVRSGYQGRPFTLYKFRTMCDVHDAQDLSLSDEKRLTRFGRFLRDTSLDELPQLWNVLRGDMSLVGPRPLLAEYLPLFDADQRRRLEVQPGITGWAQVHGRNNLSWKEKFRLDNWYVDHQSLTLDLIILWRTVGTVLARRDINQDGHATAAVFSGNCTTQAGQES